MVANYKLDDIDTSDIHKVSEVIILMFSKMFANQNSSFIYGFCNDVSDMFTGNYKDYQKMDTVYHDLDHTLQATLCWVRLMLNRHLLKVEPIMNHIDFKIGLISIMMHDVGYLKEKNDTEGTGAKFTFVHEKRSCEVADIYLDEHHWDKKMNFAVQHLIGCTGPRSIIDSIPFLSKIERIMGEAVCVADYLGQMSDPKYLDKLPVLYEEFEESDNYRGIPREDRLFKDYDELFNATPLFWEYSVKPKLQKDCHNLHLFLSEPYPDGQNPYLEKIEENIAKIKNIIAKNEISLNV